MDHRAKVCGGRFEEFQPANIAVDSHSQRSSRHPSFSERPHLACLDPRFHDSRRILITRRCLEFYPTRIRKASKPAFRTELRRDCQPNWSLSMAFLIRAVFAGLIIALVAEVSNRSPRLGALLLTLPIVSILAFVMTWQRNHDL